MSVTKETMTQGVRLDNKTYQVNFDKFPMMYCLLVRDDDSGEKEFRPVVYSLDDNFNDDIEQIVGYGSYMVVMVKANIHTVADKADHGEVNDEYMDMV